MLPPGAPTWYSHCKDEHLLFCRAIVYDSWLTWGHALPREPELLSQLDREAEEYIRTLAMHLHQVHKQMPEWKQINECHFHVKRWFDPEAEESHWREGRAALMRYDDVSAADFMALRPKRNPLIFRQVSERFFEVYLEPKMPLFALSSSSRDRSTADP